VTPAQLWSELFSRTYAAELRPERSERARHLYEADRDRYERLTTPALTLAGIPFQRAAGSSELVVRLEAGARRRARRGWWLRAAVTKLLSVLRLIKSFFLFEGGVDYAVSKVERHSGVSLGLTPWQRRHPWLGVPRLLWRLVRTRAVR
jgi:hypothetical protein